MRKSIKYSLLIVIGMFLVAILFIVKDKNKVTEKEKYRAMIEHHPLSKRLQFSKKERKKMGVPPNKYFDEQYLLEMNPSTGEVHPENMEEVKQLMRKSKRLSLVPGQNNEMAWEERGPDNIAGRTRVAFFDPNDVSNKRVISGGVSGGLWSISDITNENLEWTQIGIDENLPISCYTIDPNNSNIWYVGTGEAYTANEGTGNGLWKTTNGGATWAKVFGVDLSENDSFRPYYINEVLAWDNEGTTEIFISIDGGYDYEYIGYEVSGWWRSTDGGNNFTQIDLPIPGVGPPMTNQYVFSDVEVDINNNIWVATKRNDSGFGGGKVLKSTDGQSFTEKYSFTNGSRTEIAISKLDPDKIVALAETSSGVDLVKTNDGFSSTSTVAKPNDVDSGIPADDFTRGQAFYDLVIEIDPTNDDIFYAGGIDLFRSTNSGDSWTQISRWHSWDDFNDLKVPVVHADQHVLVFDPNDHNKGVIGNDGGIYYATDLATSGSSTTTITGRKNGLNITQFYSVSTAKDSEGELLLGGAQDNGSLLATEIDDLRAQSGINSYTDIFGGDGVMNFVDKDADYLVVSYVYNVYNSIDITGDDVVYVEIVDDQNTGDFANEAYLDDNLDILYTDGSTRSKSRISRFTNILTTPVRQNFTDENMTGDPTAIKVSPHTTASSTVFVGTEIGEVLKVTNFNTDTPVWTDIDTDNELNTGAISDIDIGTTENDLYVTFHNYGINNIYYSDDGGDTWQEKDGNYPDIPVKAIKVNPLNTDQVIIGTNMGVWQTSNFNDASPVWSLSDNGMSNVRVTGFDFRDYDNVVAAATYGRGLFTGKFTNETLSNLEIEISTSNVIVDGNIHLKSLNVEGKTQVKILSFDGRTVQSESVHFRKGDETVIPIQVPKGIYILQIVSQGKQLSKKIYVVNK